MFVKVCGVGLSTVAKSSLRTPFPKLEHLHGVPALQEHLLAPVRPAWQRGLAQPLIFCHLPGRLGQI